MELISKWNKIKKDNINKMYLGNIHNEYKE